MYLFYRRVRINSQKRTEYRLAESGFKGYYRGCESERQSKTRERQFSKGESDWDDSGRDKRDRGGSDQS